MVKKRVGGAHRYTKAVQAASKAAQSADGPKPPSHVQRKITRKVKFFEKVQQSSAAATALQVKSNVKKKRKSKKPLPDLKTLAGELELLASAQQQQQQQQDQGAKGVQSSIKHQKQRLRTGVAEAQRLQRVLQDPGFKADPFQAITNHLMHTMPAAPQQPSKQQQQQQHKAGSKKKKAKKKSSGGGGGGVADMQA